MVLAFIEDKEKLIDHLRGLLKEKGGLVIISPVLFPHHNKQQASISVKEAELKHEDETQVHRNYSCDNLVIDYYSFINQRINYPPKWNPWIGIPNIVKIN